MTPSPPIRLVVADDHPVFREGLVLILNSQPDMTVVGNCGNGREAVELVLKLTPDVVVLDLQMPELSGTAATAAIVGKLPNAKVLVLTTYDGGDDIRRAMQAGARGYLLKESKIDEVLQAIREVSRGRQYLSPAAGASFIATSLSHPLTKREREILCLISQGKANKEIGATFNISEATVKSHVNAIMQKLNVSSRTEAASVAQRRGLLRE